MKFDTVKSGWWSIVYIDGSQVIISKNIVFLSLKMDFVLANRVDTDEMPQNMPQFAALHQGLHRLQRLPVYIHLTTIGVLIANRVDFDPNASSGINLFATQTISESRKPHKLVLNGVEGYCIILKCCIIFYFTHE